MLQLRSVVSALLLVLAAGVPAPRAAEFVLLERTPDGRDTLRALGEGREARFISDGRGSRAAWVVDPTAVRPWIVSLAKPDAGTFAERVRARRAVVDAFGGELSRRVPPRAARGGRVMPRVTRTFDRLVAAVVIEATEEVAAEVRALSGVRAVTADLRVTTQLDESVHQVRGDQVRSRFGVTGQGVRVGIVDTGIDYEHPALGGGFGPGHRVAGGWDFVNDDPDPRDDNGHGTHVAGIVGANGGGLVGMAPGVTFFAYKVLNAGGGGISTDVLAALERCADPDGDPGTADHLDVVNLSLGALPESAADPMADAVDELDALGTTVVVAAGNFGRHFAVGTPGIARGAITVGSVTAGDELSNFSSRGPTSDLRIKPDLVAPGNDIVSAQAGGGAVAKSGTSMAAPHVAGAVALLREARPGWTHAELRTAVVTSAVDLGHLPTEQGSGRLDALAAVENELFVSPAGLAFGRVALQGGTWVHAETLRVRAPVAGDTNVDFTLRATLPPGLTATVEPGTAFLPSGGEAIAVVTLRATPGTLQLPDPLFMAEGAVEVRLGPHLRRVPFTTHDFVLVTMQLQYGAAFGGLYGLGRAWPSQLPFGASFMVRPGTYDALCFNPVSDGEEPFFGLQWIPVVRDTTLFMDQAPPPAALSLGLRNERGEPFTPPEFSFRLLHESGGGLGVLGASTRGVLRLPVMSNAYRFEWAAGARGAEVMYDIPGTLVGPFTPQVLTNDPGQLRRLVEHVAVVTADSVLTIEFPIMPDGEDGWFGVGFFDRWATPRATSFDLVRWTAPTPSRRHLRFARWLWTVHPARARALADNPWSGVGALWELDLGDSLAILRPFEVGPPLHGYRGRDLPFGSGAGMFKGILTFSGTSLHGWSPDFYSSRWFRDAAGTSRAGSPVEYEVARGSNVLASGSAEGEEKVLESPTTWEQEIPGAGPFDLTLRSRGWTVAGQPSVTTVRATFDAVSGRFACQGPEWFAVVANGGPVERIAFGQHRDPHVRFRLPAGFPDAVSVALEYRAGAGGRWTALALERNGRDLRAPLVPAYGDVSLRLRLGGNDSYLTPLLMEIEPAFHGEPSAAAGAQLVQARADGTGAHLTWRVGVPGATLLVERREPGAGWTERGESIVDADGIARFDDPAVAAGGAYGYRLGGSRAEVFVKIPAAGAGLAFAITPNPSVGTVQASIVVADGEPVTLSLLDLQGRVVAARTFTGLTPGLHVLPLLAPGRLPAGLYFARLKRGGEIRTTRVTLLE